MNARLALLPAFALTLAAASPAPAPGADSAALSGLGIRNIGPAVMGGRIAAMDGVAKDGRITLFVGAASGGVWKSLNGGTSFKPVFDKHDQSIGAVRIAPSDPRVVWVGTGEGWIRNSVSVGDGVYRSTDGGESWTNVGLKDSEHIAALAVDPRNADVAYAAALGHAWAPGGERGLYKTTDGGKTWQRVLFSNEDSGCASVSLDPKNPDVVYASLWQYRRQPWAFNSGGPGSGLFRSADGGRTWTKLNGDPKRGLPQGDLGRVAVAVAPSDPKFVYALVEAKESALYRSEDGGETWKKGNGGADTIIRPFYFSALFVDPKNPRRIFKPGLNLILSEDGGDTFSVVGGSAHSDFHAFWFDPSNPDHVYSGSDGGLYESQDRASTWVYLRNLPIAQYYHVAVDMARPYNVYGGLQDNSSWRGPSATGGPIQNRHWKNLFGGDGFWVQPDPTDPAYVYAESQGGEAGRIQMTTNEARFIQPQPGPGEPKLRWSWNAPLQLSPNDPKTLYMGCQYLYRSRDHGESWERVSPDLTTNDPAKQKQEESGGLTVDNSSAETYCTIYAISESPKDARVIWAGTDDGRLQVTRDGGKAWTDVAPAIPGLPKGTAVAWVEAGAHAAGTAFAAFDGHGLGDMRPHVYRTDDFGRTWTDLSEGVRGYAHVVKQDPVNPDLLYLGTEAGLWLSLDGGRSWAAFRPESFPPVPVMDLAIHPRDKDLVVATHGRGLWILDDLTPLRGLGAATLAQDSAFLPARPSERSIMSGDGWVDGDAEFNGQPPRGGAQIAYWQRRRHIYGDLRFEIFDAQGARIATLPGDPRRGANRLFWPMLLKAPRVARGASIAGWASTGPRVLEGTYTVKMIDGDRVLSSTIEIVPDPLSAHSAADRKAQFELSMALYRMLEDQAYTVARIVDLRDQASARAAQAKDPALRERLAAFAAALETERNVFVPVREGGGITGEERLREHLAKLYGTVVGYDGRPAPASYARRDSLAKDIAAAEAKLAARLKDLGPLNAALEAAGLAPLRELDRAAWDRETAGPSGAPAKPGAAFEEDRSRAESPLPSGFIRTY